MNEGVYQIDKQGELQVAGPRSVSFSIALWRNSEYFKHGVLCADFSLFFYF